MESADLRLWRNYVGLQNELSPVRLVANDFEEFVRLLLEERCDSEQLSAALHLHELLRLVERFDPTLLRLYGDVVRLPRQFVRGQAFVLVANGLERSMSARSGIRTQLSEHIQRASRIVADARDEASEVGLYLSSSTGEDSGQPHIDVLRPRAADLWRAVEEFTTS